MASKLHVPSLEEVLRSVPKKTLEEPCSDEHIVEIACEISTWRLIAPHLELKAVDEETILQNHHDVRIQRREMLRTWRQKLGSKATYGSLAKALYKTERVDLVEKVVELLEYSVCEDLHLPECVSEEQIENYLPKCELKKKFFVECHSKERKLVIRSGSEKECSEVKEYIKQKIFPLVLQFHPVRIRHIQLPHTSVLVKLHKTQHPANGGLAWFTLEDQPNLGVCSTAKGGTLIAGMNADVYESFHEKMKEQLKKLQPYQHSLKVGYEARFGRVHWRFPQGQTSAELCSLDEAEKTFFEARITGDIRELLESRTSKISKAKPKKLLDPLKVLVTIDDKQREVVAVVDENEDDGRFTLNRVYYAQPQGKLTCDIVFPNKAYDIRIAPNYAPALEEEIDDKIKETVQEMVRSIKLKSREQREIKMPVRGKNYRVKFMRRKTQTQHQCKKWILAEYDVEEFEGEKNGEIASKRKKKEIELWNQKWFPDSSNESRISRSHCAQPKSTASLSLPFSDEIEASSWTAESLMESFEDFVSVAVDIVDFLSG